MDYQTFKPHTDLQTIVKCYWTLQVPRQEENKKQLILPDGCVDICFSLGDDIKRYISETDFIIQPRQMLLGQITEQFVIEPTGFVNTFAIRFYPYGLASLIHLPLNELSNKETPLDKLFDGQDANRLTQEIIQANNTNERIGVFERFIFTRLHNKSKIDHIVKSTIDLMFLSKGSKPLRSILKNDIAKRRQLERKFIKVIGLSPKQLCKVIRLQGEDRKQG